MKFRKYFSAVLAVLFLFLSVIPASAAEESKPAKTVRVGYVLAAGYQEGGEGEYKSGYGYEYLQKIKSYTNWEYEYVYGSFSELLDGVMNGTVDLMGNVSKTEERMGKVYFGACPQGSEAYHLIIREDNDEIRISDLSSLCGKKIGINKGSVQIGLFENWLKEHEISGVKIIEYSQSSQRRADLENGVIDGMVIADGKSGDGLISLCSVGESSYYFVVNKEKGWIKRELDQAQSQILDINSNYNNSLYLKYHYDSNITRTTLSEEERNWITEHPVVKVGYPLNALPYCDRDDNGEMTGMFREYFDFVSETYGLSFEFQAFASFADILASLKSGAIHVAVPMYFDYWIAEKNDVALVDQLVTSSITHISSENTDGVKADTIALSDAYFCQVFFVQAYYPNANLIWCQDFQGCLDAVLSGAADCTFYNSDLLEVKEKSYASLRKLSLRNLRLDSPVSMAVQPGSTELMSILNKGVALTSETDTTSRMIAYAHIAGKSDYSIRSFFSDHTLETILFLIGIFSFILLVVLIAYARIVNQKRLLQDALYNYKQADYDRRIDFLTGLRNRQDMFEMLQDSLSGKRESICAMYMMDIDNFKRLNDRYGHVYGDECLSRIGEALKNYEKENDIVFYRYGGEEMLGISFNRKKPASQTAEELVQLVRSLHIDRNDTPLGCVTVSLGYTTNNQRYEKMIDKADSAMYRAKDNGKNQAVCFEEM